MIQFFKNIYLEKRFFQSLFAIALFFVIAYFFPNLFVWAKTTFYFFLLLVLTEIFLLFKNKKSIVAHRILPEKLSNSDPNKIYITLKNTNRYTAHIKLIDELPFQFQKRDFSMHTKLKPNQEKKLSYTLTPNQRGEYHFGHLNVFSKTPLQLVSKKQQFGNNAMVPSYPSFLQLRKYEFIAFSSKLKNFGFKKIRRLGQTLEFEQIKNYTFGDNIKNINWNATAKRNQLMVNQYQDEKSQPIYALIDTGRVMKMPFNQLALLDYAINATLAVSSIAIKKNDKAGMLTFSKKVENTLIAQSRNSQMQLILETLYNIKTNYVESSFSRLYTDLKRIIKQRSLLLLYTNFETLDALHRQLPYLQAIAKNHLLVVIFFENTELKKLTQQPAKTTKQIFDKTIAQKFAFEKKLIANELSKYGIQSILTAPEDLSINTINKYLEIKAKGQL